MDDVPRKNYADMGFPCHDWLSIPLHPTKSHSLLMVRLGDLQLPPLPKGSFFLKMDLKMSQTRLPLQEIVLEPAPKDPGSKLFDEAWPLEEIFTTNTWRLWLIILITPPNMQEFWCFWRKHWQVAVIQIILWGFQKHLSPWKWAFLCVGGCRPQVWCE